MIKKQIPNIITGFNLISGCISIVFAFSHLYEWAILAIFAAALFDFFDGFVARMLGVLSPVGKEMDSLADVVSFGVAPSMVLFCYTVNIQTKNNVSGWETVLPYLFFGVPMFSALRLAKFNLDTRQSLSFLGLPTPANALFLSTLTLLPPQWEWAHNIYFLLALSFITSWMLIAEIPLFALKFKSWGWKENRIKYVFLMGVVLLGFLFAKTAVTYIVIWYVALSLINNRIKI